MPKLPDPDALLQSVPADGSSIGNLKLRKQLGWAEKRYAAARDELVEQGRLSDLERRAQGLFNT